VIDNIRAAGVENLGLLNNKKNKATPEAALP
jgi:hypothetical protein